MIDWTCTECGFRPEIVHPGAYDGWWRFEVSFVGAGTVVRGGLYTMCSIDCIRKVIARLDLAALRAGQALRIEEQRALADVRSDIEALEGHGPSE